MTHNVHELARLVLCLAVIRLQLTYYRIHMTKMGHYAVSRSQYTDTMIEMPPILVLDAPAIVQARFEAYWSARGCQTHAKLLRWLQQVNEAMLAPNIVIRVERSLQQLGAIEELSIIEFSESEDELSLEWSCMCSRLGDALSKRAAAWIAEASDRCWGYACKSGSVEGMEKACRAMDEAEGLWQGDAVNPTLYYALASLGRWRKLDDCLSLRKLDTESLDDIRNTKGRVKQRDAAKRMVKKLERSSADELPPLLVAWVKDRLDYWRTQVAIVSSPE